MIQPNYKPNKQLEIYVRYREQLRQKNSRDAFAVTPIEDVIQRNYRFNLSYAISEFFTISVYPSFSHAFFYTSGES